MSNLRISTLALATVAAALSAFAEIAMPEVVSHRGESNDRPENTMAAFRLAFERGVDGVECDVYCTSDGVPVIIHDGTTGRTAGSGTNLNVTASTWAQLKDVRVGAFGKWIGTEWEGETLPKFEDYLALLSMNTTTKCIVELKGSDVNNLVSNVVAAVRAQPLATKDRVAFIAFDALLISAVRAALPDYDALLLLSNVSDSSATLNSKIAACNGTGVDIHYQAAACSSESEIAAVKAAGYKFWVWTCDDVNISFALASRGVQSVTTNKGGETKTAVASMIADANSRVEIVEPNFPAGLTAMEPGAYAKQSDLVGHFDGIRNAGTNLPHDPSTRTWKNLVSGGPDAPFTGNGGYWTANGKGFYFDGSSVYARLASPGIDLHHETSTIQLVLDAPTSQQPLGSGFYPGLFYSSDDDDFGFFLNNAGGKTRDTTLHWKVKAYRTDNRPEIANWGGKYVTGLFTKSNQYLFEGTQLANGKSCSSRTNKAAKQWSWGGSARETANRYSKGTYYSVRIYNASLTENDLVWNRLVDEIRFRGVVTNGCVEVASNRAGAEGTEASGMYYVNGNHTFTAPATVTIDGRVYEPSGYKLERYNVLNKTWDFVEVSDATSFAYTNCAVNTGARITWNWRLKSGVKKIDADDYVQGGLVLGLDGIRNAGLGVAHDPTATTWKNLGSGGDLTLTTFDSSNGAGSWKDKGYFFTAGSCFYMGRSVFLGRQATIQFAAEHNMSIQVTKWPSVFGPGNENIDRYNIYTYTARAGTGDFNRGDHLRFNTAQVNSLSIGLQPWDGRFGNAIIDGARSSVTNTATYAWQPGTKSGDIGTYRYAIGAAHNSTANRKDRAYSGEIRAFRLYDRVLAEAELAHNMEIDNMRYYAGSGRSTETNLVEVAVESPGGVVTVDEKGSWILRGDGASKTFTAPATVTVGNNTYSCTGYRLETWNAAKRMWESPVETASATTAELSSANQNRRLTWLYALTTGIRSAADYDVGDYVQQGLVANYDGIRNLGPENTHSLLGMFWHDSSYRDVPMIAASNTAFSAWNGLGHHFTAAEENFFELTEPISLGQNGTVQGVVDVSTAAQTTAYPTFFGFGNEDFSFFTRSNNKQRLESKYNTWIGDNLYVIGWEGKYFTWMTTDNTHYLIQGIDPGAGTARTLNGGIPEKKFAIGGPNTYTGDNRKKRCMTGDYHALRIYNRALTEAELVHNRTVDEIRYRGNFTNANVTVVCELPLEGVTAPVSIPAGDYEVTGSFTFTASGVTVGESTFPPYYTVETWDGSAWGEPVEYEGGSYTYTAGAKVRLTWKWADPTVPVKATWTGLGDTSNLLDPANWSCVNAAGDVITAAPTNVTTVVINGMTSFSIPEGVTTFPWKEIQFGGDVHTALRCGTWSYNSNASYTGTLPGVFTLLSAADTSLANLDNGSYSDTPSAWQEAHLKRQRVRFDGWFYVTPAQAGTWTVNQKFDDYYCFGIDGSWVVANPTYQALLIGTCDVSAGWHRFTIICGDTGGNGWGAYPGSAVQVEGVDAPISISWGDAPVRFAPSNFTFGTDAAPVITLSCDCDWSALGALTLMNGATIDLNGHNLTAQPFASDYIGAMITNSNDEVLSTVTFTVPEGKTLTGSVAICGNVKVVKKGAGTYCSCAKDCTYSGGTFIDEGKAQPPDGNGTDIQYCYDQFKAFSTNEIFVASNAVFDIRANYAYRSRVVLAGGTLTNSKADMKTTTNGGSGIGRLTEDSTLNVAWNIVFGDNNGYGDMDLGGHTLTTIINPAGSYLYLRCAKIENGKIDITQGGWLQVVNACVATNVDFKMKCALNIGNTLSVRDYEAVWASNTQSHNAGTAALNVYGTFTPAAGQKFYGCTMQDGSTIDLSGTTGAFSTLSYYTSGSTNIHFAANANVTVNLAGRNDLRTIVKSENPFVVTWPEGLGPAANVTFQVDAETARNGLKIIRDDERNGLRLVRKPSFTLIVR